ncbi:MAG: hypothetical protein WBA74_19015, partial [Cyclobacteriaceae bacterium]
MAHLNRMLLTTLCMVVATLACAQYDQEAYWSNETGIYHFNPETSTSTKIVDGGNPSVTGGIHVDTDKVYYLTNNRRFIRISDYDGGNPSILVDIETIDYLQETGSDYKVIDLAYDFANGKGYFTAVQSPVNNYAKSTSVYRTPSVVYGFDLITGVVDSLFSGIPYDTVGSSIYYEQIPSLTIDHARNKLVYLIEEDIHSRVETRDLDGSNKSLVVEGFEQGNWIEIDEATQTMFIMAGRRGRFDAIYKANLDGSDFQTLFQDNIQTDLGFLLTSSNLYFMDDNNKVLLSDLNGGNVSFSDDVFFSTSLLTNAIDETRNELYFILSGTLQRRELGVFGTTNIVPHFQFVRKLQVDEINERLFYQFGDFGGVVSMDFDGGNFRSAYTPPLGVLLLDYKLDANDNRIITLEKDETPGAISYDVYQRPLDDPENGSVISGDLNGIRSFDIDPVANNLILFPPNIIPSEAVYDFKNNQAFYFLSDNGSDAIYVTDDVTEQGKELTFFNVNDPQNLVLNVFDDKIYWSNTSGSTGQYRMNLDGTNEEKIADFPVNTLAFVSNIQAPELVQIFEDVTIEEDASIQTITENLTSHFKDPNGLDLSFSTSSDNDDIQSFIEGVFLRVDATPDYSGFATITVTASNGTNGVSTSFEVTVTPVNDPPSFELSAFALTLDHDFETQTITLTPDPVPDDEMSQTVAYSISPETVDFANVTINPNSGLITIAHLEGGHGIEQITVIADDGQAENNIHDVKFSLEVLEGDGVVLSTADEQLDVKLYPNPASDFVTIQSRGRIKSVMVYDATGKLVQSYT